MSTRRAMQLQAAILLALGLFLLNAGCPSLIQPTSTESFPEAGNGGGSVAVDSDMDGNPEAADTGTVSPGIPPGSIAQATDPGTGTSVLLESTGDGDGVQTTCDVQFTGSAGEGACDASLTYLWDIADLQGDAEFTVTVAAVGDVSDLSVTAQSQVSVECGDSVEIVTLDAANPQAILSVAVDVAASSCTATVDVTASVVSAGVAGKAAWITGATSRHVAPIQCVTNAGCVDPDQSICNPQLQICGDGETADACLVHAVNCADPDGSCVSSFYTSYPTACSSGVYSPCYGDAQCAQGYECQNDICKPGPGKGCNVDADCAAGESCLAGGGCAPATRFGYGKGCFMGDGCPEAGGSIDYGLCIGNVCYKIGLQGDDCTQTWVDCEFGLACFSSTGTCELQLAPGEVCTANDQCQGYPATHSCINDVCAPKSPATGSCEEQVDCELGLFCAAGTCG